MRWCPIFGTITAMALGTIRISFAPYWPVELSAAGSIPRHQRQKCWGVDTARTCRPLRGMLIKPWSPCVEISAHNKDLQGGQPYSHPYAVVSNAHSHSCFMTLTTNKPSTSVREKASKQLSIFQVVIRQLSVPSSPSRRHVRGWWSVSGDVTK